MEGLAEFNVPGLQEPCKTWYNICGDLASGTPLIILHGGPGAGHNYMLPLTDLAPSIPLVFYDQIGNGRSTRLPEKAGDQSFWNVDLFKNELDNLIAHLGLKDREFDVLGHSWGAMLAIEWAATSPSAAKLRRLVISNGVASIETFFKGLNELRKKLPQDVQDALTRGDETKEFDNAEYQGAMQVLFQRHFCLAKPWPPKEVLDVMTLLQEDSTVYTSMYGPTELCVTGTLRDWSCIPLLGRIKVPTLIINGTEDKATDVTVRPLFQHIEKAKWITLDNAAHISHVDQREKYMKHVMSFLRDE